MMSVLLMGLCSRAENEFSNELVRNLGICNSALSTERVFLLCVSETFLNKSFTLSGAKLFNASYTITHQLYCTLRGKDNHCSSLIILSDGVRVSA